MFSKYFSTKNTFGHVADSGTYMKRGDPELEAAERITLRLNRNLSGKWSHRIIFILFTMGNL